MKKKITLIRHAKSSWKNDALSDHDRPLNRRGKQDAPTIGQRLATRGARPSLILTSPAKRARQTARLIADTIGYPREFIQREKTLYLAAPDQILAVIAEQDNGFNDICVVGHNPGITELASELSSIAFDNVPTCGIVELETEVRTWSDLKQTRCELQFFDYPRKADESASA